jgi:hypothetical protein
MMDQMSSNPKLQSTRACLKHHLFCHPSNIIYFAYKLTILFLVWFRRSLTIIVSIQTRCTTLLGSEHRSVASDPNLPRTKTVRCNLYGHAKTVFFQVFSCFVSSHFHVILLCNLNDLLDKLSRIVCQNFLYLVDVNVGYCYPFFLVSSILNVEVCISFYVLQIIV